jgi:excisionase family DNA binding protein
VSVAEHDVMTADEVAAWLRVDRKTVYDAAGRGEIPHRRLGKRLLFHRSALVAWLTCRTASEGAAR